MLAILFYSTILNSILSVLPESLGLFVFGIVLIGSAVGLRWILGRKEESEEDFNKRVYK